MFHIVLQTNKKIHLLVANMSPHMLNQIILQLHVSFPITHVFMKLSELLKCCRYSMFRHNIFTLN